MSDKTKCITNKENCRELLRVAIAEGVVKPMSELYDRLLTANLDEMTKTLEMIIETDEDNIERAFLLADFVKFVKLCVDRGWLPKDGTDTAAVELLRRSGS